MISFLHAFLLGPSLLKARFLEMEVQSWILLCSYILHAYLDLALINPILHLYTQPERETSLETKSVVQIFILLQLIHSLRNCQGDSKGWLRPGIWLKWFPFGQPCYSQSTDLLLSLREGAINGQKCSWVHSPVELVWWGSHNTETDIVIPLWL